MAEIKKEATKYAGLTAYQRFTEVYKAVKGISKDGTGVHSSKAVSMSNVREVLKPLLIEWGLVKVTSEYKPMDMTSQAPILYTGDGLGMIVRFEYTLAFASVDDIKDTISWTKSGFDILPFSQTDFKNVGKETYYERTKLLNIFDFAVNDEDVEFSKSVVSKGGLKTSGQTDELVSLIQTLENTEEVATLKRTYLGSDEKSTEDLIKSVRGFAEGNVKTQLAKLKAVAEAKAQAAPVSALEIEVK